MDYMQINEIGSSPFPALVRIKELESERLHHVTDARQVNTKFGVAVVLELEEESSVFLPKRLSSYFGANNAEFKRMLKDVLNGILYFTCSGKNNHLKRKIINSINK